MKKNGFRRPFHKLQVISWIYAIFIICSYCIIALPIFPYETKLSLGPLFTLSVVCLLILGFICTYIDPTDPALSEVKKSIILSKAIDYKKYPKICRICKNHVNLDTKHCAECNRCVLHFDHHCKWLNNCIGVKNYKYYAYLLGSFEAFNLIVSLSAIIASAGVFQKNLFYDRLNEQFGPSDSTKNMCISLLVIIDILSSIAFIANGQLIIFHMFLAFKKLTTYQYILDMRKKKNKYRVSTIRIINDKEAIEEIPLEEMFEPYMANPQYENYENPDPNASLKIAPENFQVPNISESDESVEKT